MNNMINKYTITTFILGLIISGGIVYAANIFASDIAYDNSKSHLKDSSNQDVTYVQDAVDALYTKVNDEIQDYKDKFDTLTFEFYAQSYNSTSNSNGGFILSKFNNKYNYFKVNSVIKKVGNGSCVLVAWNLVNNSAEEISLNTNYSLNNYLRLYVRSKSNDTSENQCIINVTLFN